MKKKLQNFFPSLLLTAIILIAGGFSDGMIVSAKDNPIVPVVNIGNDCTLSQTVHYYSSETVVVNPDVPAKNSLKPCCENVQGAASAIQSQAFNQGARLMALHSARAAFDNNSVFENTLKGQSRACPPKPDILSSVLKKE